MTAPAARQRAKRVRYDAHSVVVAIPLALAGLYAVHVPTGAATQIYYCEPETDRCSCGVGSGSCSHIAVARAHATRADRAPSPMEEVA